MLFHLLWKNTVFKKKISFPLIICMLITVACGGGGGEYFPPMISVDEIGIIKEEIKDSVIKDQDKLVLSISLNSEPQKDKYIGGTKYYHFADFQYNKKKYVLGIPYDTYISILDSKGKVIKKLDTPRYSTNAKAIELVGKQNGKYLAIYISQQTTSHSSTLFILNDKFDVMYKEHLLGALWMAKEQGKNGDNLLVSAETKWIPKDEWISVGGPWRYIIFKAQ